MAGGQKMADASRSQGRVIDHSTRYGDPSRALEYTRSCGYQAFPGRQHSCRTASDLMAGTTNELASVMSMVQEVIVLIVHSVPPLIPKALPSLNHALFTFGAVRYG